MIPQPQSIKRYRSAEKRFLKPSIEKFLEREFPKFFGPVIRDKIAQKIEELVDQQLPRKQYLRPGQCVWNAVAIHTRPDSHDCQLIPVILTLVDTSDINQLSNGTPMTVIARKAIARITREAYEQGALLSMRDIGLLVWRPNNTVSTMRKRWEEEHKSILPHVGSLQDFGSCISHKAAIIKKVVYEKKDPMKVANETKHSQKAVDRYLNDFYRVKTCYEKDKDLDFISQVTGLSKFLVKQYWQLIENNEKNNLTRHIA